MILGIVDGNIAVLLVLQSGSRVPVGQLLQPLKSSQETGHTEQSGKNRVTENEYMVIDLERFEWHINNGSRLTN